MKKLVISNSIFTNFGASLICIHLLTSFNLYTQLADETDGIEVYLPSIPKMAVIIKSIWLFYNLKLLKAMKSTTKYLLSKQNLETEK